MKLTYRVVTKAEFIQRAKEAIAILEQSSGEDLPVTDDAELVFDSLKNLTKYLAAKINKQRELNEILLGE